MGGCKLKGLPRKFSLIYQRLYAPNNPHIESLLTTTVTCQNVQKIDMNP